MTSPKRIFWLLATIGVVSGCDDRSAEPEPELPAPATEQAPTRVEEKTPRVLQDSDRVEIYAEVLRQVLRKEQTPRSGALVDASGLLGLDDQQRHEVLVALEPIEPRAFFGTRDDVLRKAKESEEERDRDETARKNSGSSSSASRRRDAAVAWSRPSAASRPRDHARRASRSVVPPVPARLAWSGGNAAPSFSRRTAAIRPSSSNTEETGPFSDVAATISAVETSTTLLSTRSSSP